MKSKLFQSLMGIAILSAGLASAEARTKLTSLPDRNTMVVSLEHPSYTLVYEERDLPLQEGGNFVDFSWNGVSIDPNSVMIELLSNPGDTPDATKVIATGFPPNEQALTWQIFAPTARTERIRVSYIINGISHLSAYDLRVNEAETSGDFQRYVRISNRSGEDLEGAALRLPQQDDLSRTMDSGETRRMLAQRVRETPFEKEFIARPGMFQRDPDAKEDISLVYQIKNDAASGLGGSALPPGKVRIYGADGTGSSIFLGENNLAKTAPGEEAEIAMGLVQDVSLKRRLLSEEQLNIQRNNSRTIVKFDRERTIRYEIENFKNEPVQLQIYEPVAGDWLVTEVDGEGVSQERESINELLLTIELPPAEEGQEAEKKIVDVTLLFRDLFPGE